MKKHLSQVTYRRSLPPRPTEPYWQKDSVGCFIGFWKGASADSETWRARWVDPITKKKHFKSLGRVKDISYDKALKLAREWWGQCQIGIPKVGTVEQACRDFVKYYCGDKGTDADYYARKTFENTVYETPFGDTPLDQLRATQVEEWKRGLVVPGYRQKNTVNRMLATLKSALNYAYRQGMAPSDRAWKVVQKFQAQDNRRERILDQAERRALIESATPEVANFLRALYYTAARPREMADATVADLDLQANTLRFTTRKGTGAKREREFPLDLNPAALEFFKKMAKDKLPKAPLIARSDGGKLDRQHWGRGIKQASAIAELGSDVVAYTMRHTSISEWLAEGLDIGTVAKLAGTSVGMIDQYYHKYIPSKLVNRLAHLSAT